MLGRKFIELKDLAKLKKHNRCYFPSDCQQIPSKASKRLHRSGTLQFTSSNWTGLQQHYPSNVTQQQVTKCNILISDMFTVIQC